MSVKFYDSNYFSFEINFCGLHKETYKCWHAQDVLELKQKTQHLKASE